MRSRLIAGAIAGAPAALLRWPLLALVIALLAQTLIFVACQGDFVVSDPLWYADLAHQIADDPSEVFAAPENHPFVMRVGLTLPVALLYRVFGVSSLTTNSLGLLGALGVVLVVYAAAPTPRAKLIGMLMCVASAALAREARLLHPDLPCAALMAWSILCLSRRARPRGAAWLAAAMVLWFSAFLVKESALWCAPVWVYAAVLDLRAGGLRPVLRAYAPALATGAALAAAYLAVCAVVWGDPWARFAGIQQLSGEHSWSMTGAPRSAWLARLVWQPPLLLLRMFWVALIPMLLAPWLVRGPERIWWFASGSIVLLFWFGSSSASGYAPLPVVARMAFPALPCLLVLATLGADAALDRARDRVRHPGLRLAILGAFAGALLVPSVLAIRSMAMRGHPEHAAYATLRGELAAADPSRRYVLVCSDPYCRPIAAFYFGFELPPNLTIIPSSGPSGALPPPPPPGATVRAIVNRRRTAAAVRAREGVDWAAPIDALGMPAIVARGQIRLYDAGDGARLWAALAAQAR